MELVNCNTMKDAMPASMSPATTAATGGNDRILLFKFCESLICWLTSTVEPSLERIPILQLKSYCTSQQSSSSFLGFHALSVLWTRWKTETYHSPVKHHRRYCTFDLNLLLGTTNVRGVRYDNITYHNIQTTYDTKKGGRQNDLGWESRVGNNKRAIIK
jgi:hypothetical protein